MKRNILFETSILKKNEMGKLSVEMISKLGPGFNKRRADETVDHFLSRLTHIYLQEKHIDGIVSFEIDFYCWLLF